MPGVYSKNKFDLAGFSVGIVSKKKILSKKKVKNKNIILAIPSNGVHSNGYSLIRSILNNSHISRNLKRIDETYKDIFKRNFKFNKKKFN